MHGQTMTEYVLAVAAVLVIFFAGFAALWGPTTTKLDALTDQSTVQSQPTPSLSPAEVNQLQQIKDELNGTGPVLP